VRSKVVRLRPGDEEPPSVDYADQVYSTLTAEEADRRQIAAGTFGNGRTAPTETSDLISGLWS
jgi:hypothetical protein